MQNGRKYPSKASSHEVEAMSRGGLRLSIDVQTGSASSVITHFLRDFRGRPDFASLTLSVSSTTSDVSVQLEEIRNHLMARELDEAQRILKTIEPNCYADYADVELERARLNFFRADYSQALACVTKALDAQEISEITRMTCLQLKGHALIFLKDHAQAIQVLKLALTLAELFPQATSSASARGCLIMAYSETGQRDHAQSELTVMASQVAEIESDELWLYRLLYLIRSEVHFSRAFLTKEMTLRKLCEAREIALWIGDAISVANCERELVQAGVEIQTLNLKSFEIFSFANWVYIADRELILNRSPKRIIRMNDRPMATRLLRSLMNGPQSIEALFLNVWNLKYDSERHGSHLRATLSKLRKLLPTGTLIVEDNQVMIRIKAK